MIQEKSSNSNNALNNYTVISKYVSPADQKHFDRAYNEVLGVGNDFITFDSFKEIVITSNKFGRNVVNGCLDKIRKRLKENISNQHEGDLILSKN